MGAARQSRRTKLMRPKPAAPQSAFRCLSILIGAARGVIPRSAKVSGLPLTARSVSLSDLQVLAFDVFGTVVDWHGSIVREAMSPGIGLSRERAEEFALAWREGYRPAMQRVRGGELGWTRIDDLHRIILEGILPRFGLAHLNEPQRAHLNLA